MKRKIIGATLLVALAIAAGWNYNQSENETTLSELGMANVEALARGESASDYCDDFTSQTCISHGVTHRNMYPAGAL